QTLTIRTEGRVLDRGAVGDRVRVMNLTSRSTVSGIVAAGGTVVVSPLGGNS
ncbi:MAG: flagella basal body P-ring formation protein FlgA, partial [Pseudomonadota bacterium]